jgi:predicted small secreted protein
MKRFISLLILMVITLSLVLTGCPTPTTTSSNTTTATSNPTTPPVVGNFIEYNGVKYDITSAAIWYWDNIDRGLSLYCADLNLNFSFTNMGDYNIPANEIPIGTWTTISTNFPELFINNYFLVSANQTKYINSSSTYLGSFNVSGTPRNISITGNFSFTDTSGTYAYSFNYSGPYSYQPD